MSRTERLYARSFRPRIESLEARLVPTTADYVNSVYVDLLRRTPTSAEVTTGTQQIDTGTSAFQFATNLVNSQEFIINDVYNDYGTYLNRLPQANEVSVWVNARNAGLPPRLMAAQFMGSLEFFKDNASDNIAWLNAVYNEILGRAVDASGETARQMQLNAGVSRTLVAFEIANSAEGNARAVAAAYFRVLQRQPDQSGETFWTAQMAAGLSPTSLLADLASSPEFVITQSNGGLDTGMVRLVVSTPGGPVPSSGGVTYLPNLSFGPNFAATTQLNETFRINPYTSSSYTGSLGG
jgi:hypothetical protein